MRDRYLVEEEVEWRGKYRVDVVVVWREREREREKDVGGAEAEAEAEWAFTNDNLSLFFRLALVSSRSTANLCLLSSPRLCDSRFVRAHKASILPSSRHFAKKKYWHGNEPHIHNTYTHTHARTLRVRASTHGLAHEMRRMKGAHVLCLVTSRLPIFIYIYLGEWGI